MSFVRKLVLIAFTVSVAQGAIAGLLMKPTSDPDLIYKGAILEEIFS